MNAPTCNCEQCEGIRREMVKRGEPLTWYGRRILTEHELAQIDFPPEPDDFKEEKAEGEKP